MNLYDFLMITDNLYLSAAVWLVALIFLLYFARLPAHRIISALTRTIRNAMRFAARSINRLAAALAERNKEVLLEQGRQTVEHRIEREFTRIDASVQRDLAQYPALHRHLSEEIQQIDDHYNESTDVPPEAPGWAKAVEAIAKIPGKDPLMAGILEDIHGSMLRANTQALEEYRKASHRRHEHLKRMMPHWREVRRILGKIDTSVNRLLERSARIDRLMQQYQEIANNTSGAVRMLGAAAFRHFIVSTFVLVLAVGAAIFNFNLIAHPLQQMMGEQQEILGLSISDIAAVVMIFLAVTLGIFFMEAVRWTRLFPLVETWSENARQRTALLLLGLLFVLAFLEAGLAFMRGHPVSSAQITMGLLPAEGEALGAEVNWISLAAPMGIAFIMPFVLALAMIVLEHFLHSLRTVLAALGVGLLRLGAWLLRLVGVMTHYLGRILTHIYDFVIFAPLWLERLIRSRYNKRLSTPRRSAVTSRG